METFGKRLRKRAESLGRSDAEIARKLGISARRYSYYVNNEREPDYDLLVKICRVLETTPNDLLGIGTPLEASADDATGDAPKMFNLAGEQFVAIPRWEMQAAAGAGRDATSAPVLLRYHMFRLSWLRSITQAPLDQLHVLEVNGDSMEPALRSGDVIMVDQTQTEPHRRDGIYVLNRDGDLQVKRVSVHPVTGRLSLRSDNMAYESYSDIDPRELDVVGRVVWIARQT